MGLTVQWAVKCNDENCMQRIRSGLEKLDKTFFIRDTSSIIACTGQPNEDAICIPLKFEPWEKALEQSYVMRRARFEVLGFGNPTFEGEGPFGHHMPKKMVELLKNSFGTPYKTFEADPVLGEGGYQTGNWTKTQYVGIETHVRVCKILDTIRDNADKTIIGDDGHYCGDGDKHDMGTLMDSFEEYTEISNIIGGKLRDAGWKDKDIAGGGEDTYQRLKSGK
jgi:hypothetical protein